MMEKPIKTDYFGVPYYFWKHPNGVGRQVFTTLWRKKPVYDGGVLTLFFYGHGESVAALYCHIVAHQKTYSQFCNGNPITNSFSKSCPL